MTPRRIGWARRASRIAAALVVLLASTTGGHAQYSSGGYSAPRRAPSSSSSGGYARPSGGGSTYQGGTSAGDQAFSRGNSATALQQYRDSQAPPPPPPRRAQDWSDPGYVQGARRPATGSGFGLGEGFVAGALLGALGSSRRDATPPGWDGGQRYAQGQPALPGKPPPLPASAPSGGGGGMVWLILLALVAAFAGLWLLRRRAAGAGTPAAVKAPAGSAAAGFRVGMTFQVDPAPFALAAGITKVKPLGDGGLASIEAVGRLRDGDILLQRLYLPGRAAFFQIFANRAGDIQECRYFSLLDQVSPATPQEWDLWLGAQQGMIGWPAFQTKDGKQYSRAWSPGGSRIPPRDLAETIEALGGTSERTLHAMLYAAATGAAAPAPPTEYVLVSAIEADRQAWVEVCVGIDINPAALGLPSVRIT